MLIFVSHQKHYAMKKLFVIAILLPILWLASGCGVTCNFGVSYTSTSTGPHVYIDPIADSANVNIGKVGLSASCPGINDIILGYITSKLPLHLNPVGIIGQQAKGLSAPIPAPQVKVTVKDHPILKKTTFSVQALK